DPPTGSAIHRHSIWPSFRRDPKPSGTVPDRPPGLDKSLLTGSYQIKGLLPDVVVVEQPRRAFSRLRRRENNFDHAVRSRRKLLCIAAVARDTEILRVEASQLLSRKLEIFETCICKCISQ